MENIFRTQNILAVLVLGFCIQSVRAEPKYADIVVYGNAAVGVAAASIAIDYKVTVRDVDYSKLKKRLIADKQQL